MTESRISSKVTPRQAERVDNSLKLQLAIAKLKIIEDKLGYEMGEKQPDPNILWGLCEFLKQSIDDLEQYQATETSDPVT